MPVDFQLLLPLLPTTGDVGQAIAFYRDKLGFDVLYVHGDPPTMAEIRRGEVTLQLTEFSDRHVAENVALRIRVQGVDDLHAEYVKNGLSMGRNPDGFMNTVTDKPWGTREFSVIDPAGVCIAFYELKAAD